MKTLSVAALALLMSAATASAQNATTQGRPAEQQRRTGSQANAEHGDSHANKLDHQIAACLLLGNQEEVAVAQMAEQHAQHPQVKEFAKMLVQHHTQAIEKIRKASPDLANVELSRETGGGNQSGASDHGDQALAMAQAIKAECLALTEKELSQHKGVDFDKAFVGQQLGAHLGMLAHLRGSKQFASPELQKLIAEGEKMTTSHMDAGRKLMEQIKDKTQTAQAQPGARAPQR